MTTDQILLLVTGAIAIVLLLVFGRRLGAIRFHLPGGAGVEGSETTKRPEASVTGSKAGKDIRASARGADARATVDRSEAGGDIDAHVRDRTR